MEKVNKKQLEIVSDIERKVLSFILRDVKYVEYIFNLEKVDLSNFIDKDVKSIVELCLDYYKKYKNKLVEKEFENYITSMFNKKEIDKVEYQNLNLLFDSITGDIPAAFDGVSLEDDQFNKIFEDWLNIEASLKVRKALEKNIDDVLNWKGLEVIDNLKREFERIHKPGVIKSPIDTLSLSKDYERQIDDASIRREYRDKIAINTGVEEIDKVFCGMERGTLTAFGGLIGHGKSTVCMNVSRNQYLDDKKILVISLEMPVLQWSRKLNCSYIGAKYKGILTGDKTIITNKDFEIYKEYIKNRSKGPDYYNIIYIPANAYTWDEIVNIIDEKYPNYNPDLIYVDQLSLISLGNYRTNKRNEALGDLTRDIRSFAQIRNIAVGIAVQANRASVIRDPKGERKIDINIENIEDSNKIGAHLDNFIAVMKPNDRECVVKIVKQREGEAGKTIILKGASWETGYIGGKEVNTGEKVAKTISEMESVEEELYDLGDDRSEAEKLLDSELDDMLQDQPENDDSPPEEPRDRDNSKEFSKKEKEYYESLDIDLDEAEDMEDVIANDIENIVSINKKLNNLEKSKLENIKKISKK